MERADAYALGGSVAELDSVLDSIETAYRSNYAPLLHVATAIVGDAGLAEDALQEAFLRAIQRRRSYRGDGSVEGWLWRIVVNAARDAVGRKRELPTDELPEHPQVYGAANDVSELRAAVSSLPERQRLVLFLRYFAELDYRTIAQVLEISAGTVGATLNSAHNTLRKNIEEVEPR